MFFLNGKFVNPEQAQISCNDRGLLLSDGLFETMRVYRGKVFRLKKHWDRLENGASVLKLSLGMDYLEFEKTISELLSRNDLSDQDAVLRLTITRGQGPRGLVPPTDVSPTCIMAAFPTPLKQNELISAHIVQIRRNEFSPLSNVKSLSYLDNVLARQEAIKEGAEEAILLNTRGYLAEAAAANVFIVTQENKVLTPRLEDGALAGITREAVIEICNAQRIPLTESVIEADELLAAKEVFITNSVIEIQTVAKISGHLIGRGTTGEMAKLISNEYKKQTNAYTF